jgi:hypothetical protein
VDIDVETIALAMDRIVAAIGELRAVALDEARRRSMDDLTMGRLATVADKLENVVTLLSGPGLRRLDEGQA